MNRRSVRGGSQVIFIALWGIAVVLAPLASLLVASFAKSWFWPRLLPGEWTWNAWRDAVSPAGGLGEALANSIGLATACAVLAVALALPAAQSLARLKGSMARSLEGTLVVLSVLPPVILGSGTQVLFLLLGLSGTHLGVLLAHLMITLPYATLILLGAVRLTDVRFELLAASLGADARQRIRRVRIPMLWPSVGLALAFAFLISWGQYALTLLVGGGRISTLPTVVFAQIRSGDEGHAGVASVLLSLPALLLTPFLARRLARIRPGAV